MFKRRLRLPSPALVISMVALCLVLGGTAVAASSPGDTKADKKLIKKLAPSLSVKHAKTADSATTAGTAVNATNATNATHATSATSATTATQAGNANTVGGHKVQQFFVSQPTNTAAAVIESVDGITFKASCDGGQNPTLTVENDSGHAGMMAGYSNSGGLNTILKTNFAATPVDLTGGLNGGGNLNIQLDNGGVVSVQFAATGTIGGAGSACYFSGSVIAS